MFSFEEHPDFYLRTQALGVQNLTINQDYNTKVQLPAAPGGTCTAVFQSGTTAADILIPTATTDVHITSTNTFMAGGSQHIAHHTMDKHYVYLVPPPTTDESLIQEANMYITYECGMEVSLRADMLSQKNQTMALGQGRILGYSQSSYVGNTVFATPISGTPFY